MLRTLCHSLAEDLDQHAHHEAEALAPLRRRMRTRRHGQEQHALRSVNRLLDHELAQLSHSTNSRVSQFIDEFRRHATEEERDVFPAPEQAEKTRPHGHRWMWFGGGGLASVALALALTEPKSGAAAGDPQSWVEGRLIDVSTRAVRIAPSDAAAPTTLVIDFNRTSVFKREGVLNTAHLREGQQVRALTRRGMVKALEILSEPAPTPPWAA